MLFLNKGKCYLLIQCPLLDNRQLLFIDKGKWDWLMKIIDVVLKLFK